MQERTEQVLADMSADSSADAQPVRGIAKSESGERSGYTVGQVKRALYFGCIGAPGHFLHVPDRGQMTHTSEVQGFPWDYSLLDSGLLNNRKVPDAPDGRVHWTGGGRPTFWLAFFWWDRSGDRRGNSNSGFYVEGFSHHDRQVALDFACQQWPQVVARQRYPLVLQELHPEAP